MKMDFSRQPLIANSAFAVIAIVILQLFGTEQFANVIGAFGTMLESYGMGWNQAAAEATVSFLVLLGQAGSIVASLYRTYTQVTPVAKPRNNDGEPLVPESLVAAEAAALIKRKLDGAPTETLTEDDD